ncbi:MAG: C10 family peptidase [Muribaculaceae bacterium]|nr:C10 family peptidase [Muribaculaceae bacterium]
MRTVNYLRTLMLTVLALSVATMTAASVDSRAAQARAVQFMNSLAGTRFMASPANMKLTHAEKSVVNAKANDYYVFNMEGGGYVIVSGDDRAEEILGYGSGHMDVNNLPCNVAWWLGHYKEQMEYLIANPKLQVETPSMMSTTLRATTVPQLLTCTWDQEAPYYNQCPTSGGQHCMTGCVATAMAQVMYYWKYPATLPAVEGYYQQANSYYGVPALTLEDLPATTLDWANMIDDYSSVNYTTAQANAVAKLMRYCGQAAKMEYTPDGSGAYSQDQMDAMVMFGYNSGAEYVQKSDYNNTNWNAMMQAELEAHRPILYGGNDYSAGGHAFVVDGYNATSNKYHVNFGWSGYDDNYYALDAFTGSGYTFNYYQDMIINVYPEGSVLETYAPVMADASNVGTTSFKATWTDQTPSENVTDYTLYVQSYDPNNQSLLIETFGGVTASSDGSSRIDTSLDTYCDNAGWTGSYVYQAGGGGLKLGNSSNGGSVTTPALDLSTSGGTITVQFNAKTYNTDATVLTVSCGNASETVTLTGTATDYTVTLSGVTAAAGQNVTIASSGSKKRWYIYSVEISTGASKLTANETGDANSRIITGITSKNYTVNGLNQGGSYKFYVEANYTDGSKKVSNVKTVTLEGTAVPTPELVVDPETLTMTANVGETATATFDVLGADLTGNVTLTLNDANGVFTINPATISIADAEEGATVTVTYAPTAAASHNATVTVASEGAEPVTVTLNGTAALQTSAPVMAAASNVTQSSFTATWTDATPAQNVNSYTLYVNRLGAAAAFFTETFDKIDVTKDGTYDRGETLDDYCDNAGWTGYAVYEAVGGGIKLGSGSKLGYVTTPALDLTNCGGTVTVTLNAKSYGSDNTSITVSCGDVSETVALSDEASDYNVVLTGVTAANAQNVTISSLAAGKRFYIYNVAISAGQGAVADSRVITGITAKTYTVDGLTAGETYEFYVEANYTDNTTAASNHQQVTLEAGAPAPAMIVDNETLEMSAAVLGNVTATFDVLASDLTGNVTVTLNDETGFFTVAPATISIADAEEGATVTVTYAPTTAGEHTATITLTSEGAEDVTVTINATATMDTLEPEMQPADEEYVTTTSFRADWLDITPEEYVTSYTLYVNKKQDIPAGATLLTETFGGEEDAPENDDSRDIGENNELDDFFENAGWTGYGVYLAGGGGVKLGAGTKIGTLTTPALDLTNCGGTITVKFNAKNYSSDASSVIVTCGEVSDTVELTAEAADYTVVLTGVPAEADQNVTLSGIANKKRFYLYSVTIIGGEETSKAIVETGDADSRVITGITNQYYVVENLTPGATYTYYVEANYIDDTKAASNVETVTLLEDQGHGFEPGDVNHDHQVSIADVSALIDYLLDSQNSDACTICADVNGDKEVSIADVSALIDYLLGN